MGFRDHSSGSEPLNKPYMNSAKVHPGANEDVTNAPPSVRVESPFRGLVYASNLQVLASFLYSILCTCEAILRRAVVFS